MRIRLTDKFEWKVPGRRVWQSYNPGEYTVTREMGEAAAAAGVGEELDAPKKQDVKPKPVKRSKNARR